MMRVRFPGLALPMTVLVALVATGIAGPVTPPRPADVDVRSTETILAFDPAGPNTAPVSDTLARLVALPRNASTARAVLLRGTGEVVVTDRDWRQRGRPVVLVEVRDPGPGAITVGVRHDGNWAGERPSRLDSPAFAATLGTAPDGLGLKSAAAVIGGSYVVVCGPQYAGALAPLVEWKTRKGWPVHLVTTDETGTTNDGIRSWLEDAYQTWDVPPEHVLLVGDVADIPSWNFSGNVTDLPYALLDGDDWFPDVMLGRFSVSNQSECQAMVAKTVAYERNPYLDQSSWITRSLMVAGQYASTTPMHTVRFCGEQLASLGFDPIDPVTPLDQDGNYIVSPLQPQYGNIGIPQNFGPPVIKANIEAGCSMIVYRGWAYGTAGWEPPHYTVDEIPSLQNGAMTPVVMSFVCLNGDFAAADACFGEVFTRVGGSTPDQFKGAVAFIGNGEHWSHTRYNDAMAISTFERIVDPEITTLGGLLNASKHRFLEYYPGQIEDQGDENSVEFYFYIYNLLGDPELNFYRAVPTPLAATHPDALPAGTSFVEVAVTEDGAPTVVAGARVAVTQAGAVLGVAMTGDDGRAHVALDPPVADGAVHLTVTHPDRVPYEAEVGGATAEVFVTVDDLGLDDAEPAPGQGNGDGVANPGEVMALLPSFRNLGSESSEASTVELTVTGPATVTDATSDLAAIPAGGTASAQEDLGFSIDPAAENGALITGHVEVVRDDDRDHSGFTLTVAAPDLRLSAATAAGDAWIEPGTTSDLTVTIVNAGELDVAGGTLTLSLTSPETASLLTGSVGFGAVAAGGSATCGPVSVALEPGAAAGGAVVIQAEATCDGGPVQARALTVPIGRGDVTEPAGPDAYGYYAYDSADYLYPDQRPVYAWRELSTAFGGPGTKLPFENDNYDTEVTVELPFTFTFYGQDFDRMRVSDNGWISFEDTNDDYNFYNWTLPSQHGNGAVIAPFWDNLTPEPAADPDGDPVGLDSDGVYWYHDEDAGEFLVEWSRMRHVKPEITDWQTFQVVLRDPARYPTPTGDGEILYLYRQVVDNDHVRMYASVGIESPDEMDGLQLTHDSIRSPGTMTFGPGQAIRVTTAAPVRVPLAVASLTRREVGDGTELRWRLDDERPVLGWRIYGVDDGRKVALTREPLPASARTHRVETVGQDLVLEALLPHGATCEAGKSRAGAVTAAFALGPPSPNPVRGEASIAFALPRAGHARLRVFDVRGRLVRTLIDGETAGGQGLVTWRGRDNRGQDLPDGLYFYRLEHAGQSETRKILLVR
ncbi:T9SS type A sorting domain-containing protein [bacterium]|nr:T9SS type A sorting domain-containing protein [bacterium]